MLNKKYNILLLVTDQQRFDTLGFMGNKIIKTPNIDKIAYEGTVFGSAYSACPSCVPARASLISGMNQWNHGILGMGEGQGPMGTNFPHTIAGELSKAGYYCKGIGKMHFFPQRSMNGFHHIELDESRRREDTDFCSDYERWFNDHKTGDYGMSDGRDWNGWEGKPYDNPVFLHPTIWTANQSIQFLKDRDRSMPFLLKTSFARPHSPYDAPPEYFKKYHRKKLPEAVSGEWSKQYADPAQVNNPAAPYGKMSNKQIAEARTGYYGNVELIDHEVGRIIEELERQNILNDTMIIFTSDHGDMLGDHCLWRKTYAYEGSAHIPMLLRIPKNLKRDCVEKCDKPVTLMDIMPTILDVLGLDIPDSVDGSSMLSLIYGEKCKWRDYIQGEHSAGVCSKEGMFYLTDGKVKYIWFPKSGTEQLFDLKNDPYETIDLANFFKHSSLLLDMRNRLIKELEPRNSVITSKHELLTYSGPIVSPNYKKRVNNMSHCTI